jgi:hypothetical protein
VNKLGTQRTLPWASMKPRAHRSTAPLRGYFRELDQSRNVPTPLLLGTPPIPHPSKTTHQPRKLAALLSW